MSRLMNVIISEYLRGIVIDEISRQNRQVYTAATTAMIMADAAGLDLDTAFNCSLNAAFFIRLFAGINGRFYSLHSSHSKS